jgi:hypothetical protein
MQKGQFYETAGGSGIETPETGQATIYQDTVSGNTKIVYSNNAQSGILGALVQYGSNAAALAGGLVAGDYYILNTAGEGSVAIVL